MHYQCNQHDKCPVRNLSSQVFPILANLGFAGDFAKTNDGVQTQSFVPAQQSQSQADDKGRE